MSEFAIVAVGYNRPDSMKCLLDSISKVKTHCLVDLVISIDKGQRQKEVIKIAESFEWKHGEKVIRAFSNRQGLRKHIIQCGDLTEKYKAVIVLEDDLVVSPYFISYVEQAIRCYGSDNKIAGISLYKHCFHPGVARPFEPAHNGYDAFMMQFAQSWGQCWTRDMWTGFRTWYTENEFSDLSEDAVLPEYISEWNEHSWLKYYMRYIVEQDLYYVYPIISLTSNSSDVGQHCTVPNNDYQVPLLGGEMSFRLPKFDQAVVYDVYFERKGINPDIFPDISGLKLLDLYGCRNNYRNADYLISTNSLPYEVIKEVALRYRPIEQNCIQPEEGKGIFVYNLKSKREIVKKNTNVITRYDVRGVHWRKLLKLGVSGLRDALMLRIKKR